MRIVSHRALLPGSLFVAIPCGIALAQSASEPPVLETVYYDTLDEHGRLTGGAFQLDVPPNSSFAVRTPAARQTLSAAPANPANRVDFIFVGDGYTQAELGLYAAQVDQMAAGFFAKVPYSTYRDYFAVHRIDVVSAESGVDNDPTLGIQRNTALDMEFWCNGVDRALCVNVSKAYSYAFNAPDVDVIAALANSGTYGGVGYPAQSLCTCAAGNAQSVELLQHELGHALGKLADEYDYGGPSVYVGSEPALANVSKLDAAAMLASGKKWARWLGTDQPEYDGLVSTFQGAHYSQIGIYRPTFDSQMRTLGRPFNLPSVEALILEIYQHVEPIDASSSTAVAYTGTETLHVVPMAPVGASLKIQWSLDGVDLPGATSASLDLAQLSLSPCPHVVRVKVWDATPLVRNETLRAQRMTQTLVFAVQTTPPAISTYCSATLNSSGSRARIAAFGTSSLAVNDLVLEASGCPPLASGFFLWGLAPTQTALGNGNLCVQTPVIRMAFTRCDETGSAAFSFPAPTWSNYIVPGTDVYFQYWFKDVAAGGARFDLSDGLKVRFCP